MKELVIGLSVCAAGVVFAIAMDAYSCGQKSEAMGMQYKWGLTIGCMVRAKDGWVPMGQYRVME